MDATVGLDIGGTKTLVVVELSDGSRGTLRIPTPGDYAMLLSRTAQTVQQLVGGHTIRGISASVAGEFSGEVVVGSGNIPCLVDKCLAADLESALGAPCRAKNDCYYGALAEQQAAHEPLIYLTWSTGIGGAVAYSPHVIRSTAMGHMTIVEAGRSCGCEGRGHWEAYCGGANIEQHYGVMPSRLSPGTLKEVLGYMATGIRNLSTLFPDMPVVMGGSIALAYLTKRVPFNLLKAMVKTRVATTHPPELRLARHGNDSCIEGALIAARSLNA